jgi:hypothetical protein
MGENMDIDNIIYELEYLSDEDKLRYMMENQDKVDMVLMLDNDDTFITFPDYEDKFVSLDEYIGNAYGVFTLLNLLGIKHDSV